MKNEQAHEKLKQINKQRNLIGVGGFKDSRRTRCDQNEKFNTAMSEMNKLSDEQKLKDMDNE